MRIFLFVFRHTFCVAFFLTKKNRSDMQLTLIKNYDDTKSVSYKIARIIYAETNACALHTVEAFASMIYNIHVKYNKSFKDIAGDKNMFNALNENSQRHNLMNVTPDDKKFQMCLRVAQKMMRGNLRDCVFGATNFHHVDVMPDWARARGYIAECDDLLFYL